MKETFLSNIPKAFSGLPGNYGMVFHGIFYLFSFQNSSKLKSDQVYNFILALCINKAMAFYAMDWDVRIHFSLRFPLLHRLMESSLSS